MIGQRLYLVGLRGTGKSTVGAILASRLGLPFHDADAVLEATAGRTILDIFTADGEPTFRELEGAVLRELSESDPAVIATGGGVVLREENRQRMRESGRVIWLAADPDTLWQRTQSDRTTPARRPNLSVGGRAEVAEMLRKREPLYRGCADLIVETAGRSPEQIVSTILDLCSTSSWNRDRSS